MSPEALLILTCFAILPFGVTAFLPRSGGSIHDVSLPAARPISPIHNYDQYLRPDSQLPDSLRRALHTFQDVEKLPSCNKMAASALLHSCATLEDTASDNSGDISRGPDLLLDEAKSIFATRFAVCEIAEAKGLIPQECRLFIPSEHNTRKKGYIGKITGQSPTKPNVNYPVYESNTEQYLESCRGALGRSPQLWTSYSNSRQNAVSICHAVRGEIEKDEQLHLHKVLAETTVGVHETLHQSKETADQAGRAFHELVLNVRQFHEDLFAEDRERQTDVRRMWTDLSSEMRGGVEDIIARIHKVGENLQSTDLQVTDSGRQALRVIDEILSTVTTLVNEHSKGISLIKADASTAQEQVRYANELFQQNLVQGIYSMTNSLETSNSLARAAQQNMKDLSFESANSAGLVTAIGMQLLAMGEQIQELKSDHEEMRDTVNGTRSVVSALRDEVEATRSAMAAITGFFTSIADALDQLPTIAWYALYALIFVGALLAFWLCPGSLFLLRTATACSAQILRWPFQNVASILTIVVVGGYMTFIEQPSQTIHRWALCGFTIFEQVLAGVFCACLLSAWVIACMNRRLGYRSTAAPSFADDEMGEQKSISQVNEVLPLASRRKTTFWFNDPKQYAKRRPV